MAKIKKPNFNKIASHFLMTHFPELAHTDKYPKMIIELGKLLEHVYKGEKTNG